MSQSSSDGRRPSGLTDEFPSPQISARSLRKGISATEMPNKNKSSMAAMAAKTRFASQRKKQRQTSAAVAAAAAAGAVSVKELDVTPVRRPRQTSPVLVKPGEVPKRCGNLRKSSSRAKGASSSSSRATSTSRDTPKKSTTSTTSVLSSVSPSNRECGLRGNPARCDSAASASDTSLSTEEMKMQLLSLLARARSCVPYVNVSLDKDNNVDQAKGFLQNAVEKLEGFVRDRELESDSDGELIETDSTGADITDTVESGPRIHRVDDVASHMKVERTMSELGLHTASDLRHQDGGFEVTNLADIPKTPISAPLQGQVTQDFASPRLGARRVSLGAIQVHDLASSRMGSSMKRSARRSTTNNMSSRGGAYESRSLRVAAAMKLAASVAASNDAMGATGCSTFLSATKTPDSWSVSSPSSSSVIISPNRFRVNNDVEVSSVRAPSRHLNHFAVEAPVIGDENIPVPMSVPNRVRTLAGDYEYDMPSERILDINELLRKKATDDIVETEMKDVYPLDDLRKPEFLRPIETIGAGVTVDYESPSLKGRRLSNRRRPQGKTAHARSSRASLAPVKRSTHAFSSTGSGHKANSRSSDTARSWRAGDHRSRANRRTDIHRDSDSGSVSSSDSDSNSGSNSDSSSYSGISNSSSNNNSNRNRNRNRNKNSSENESERRSNRGNLSEDSDCDEFLERKMRKKRRKRRKRRKRNKRQKLHGLSDTMQARFSQNGPKVRHKLAMQAQVLAGVDAGGGRSSPPASPTQFSSAIRLAEITMQDMQRNNQEVSEEDKKRKTTPKPAFLRRIDLTPKSRVCSSVGTDSSISDDSALPASPESFTSLSSVTSSSEPMVHTQLRDLLCELEELTTCATSSEMSQTLFTQVQILLQLAVEKLEAHTRRRMS